MREKKKLVLILDDATFHCSDNLKKKCKECDIEILILPGGTTSFLQPLDVVVNKPYKDKLRELYQKWMIDKCLKQHEEDQINSYFKPPDDLQILQWIVEGKTAITQELMKMAFEKTGITNDERKNQIFENFAMKFDSHQLDELFFIILFFLILCLE